MFYVHAHILRFVTDPTCLLFHCTEKELVPGGSIRERGVQAHAFSRALSLNDSDVLPGVGVCERGSSQVEPGLPALAEPTGKVRRHQSWPTRLFPGWSSASAAWRNTDYGNSDLGHRVVVVVWCNEERQTHDTFAVRAGKTVSLQPYDVHTAYKLAND